MAKEREIALVVKKYSLKEAEDADDEYWAKTSVEYRLQTLIELREMVFGSIKEHSIEKVVYKRNIHEEADA